MISERRLGVLRAIVEDYVCTREPVASKALAQKYSLGVSSATVRNDMALLEEEGLIAAPHTSAGRVPTEKGYRIFVDQISHLKPLSSAEKKAIRTLLESSVDLDEVLENTVRVLAQLTQQVAVLQYPASKRSKVRHIELVSMGERKLLLVLITETGYVEQRVIDMPQEVSENFLGELRARLNAVSAGRSLVDLPEVLEDVPAAFVVEDRDNVHAVFNSLNTLVYSDREDKLLLAGMPHLLRSTVDFSDTIGPVLEALEEQVVVLRLLNEMDEDSRGVAVRIGSENSYDSFAQASVIASDYGVSSEVSAKVAILGPTRMDYPSSIVSVRAVARYLSKILAG